MYRRHTKTQAHRQISAVAAPPITQARRGSPATADTGWHSHSDALDTAVSAEQSLALA